MVYSIEIAESAEKDREKIKSHIDDLAFDPRPNGCKSKCSPPPFPLWRDGKIYCLRSPQKKMFPLWKCD